MTGGGGGSLDRLGGGGGGGNFIIATNTFESTPRGGGTSLDGDRLLIP